MDKKKKSTSACSKSQEDIDPIIKSKRVLRKEAIVKTRQKKEELKKDQLLFPEREIDGFEHSLHHERRERM